MRIRINRRYNIDRGLFKIYNWLCFGQIIDINTFARRNLAFFNVRNINYFENSMVRYYTKYFIDKNDKTLVQKVYYICG